MSFEYLNLAARSPPPPPKMFTSNMNNGTIFLHEVIFFDGTSSCINCICPCPTDTNFWINPEAPQQLRNQCASWWPQR